MRLYDRHNPWPVALGAPLGLAAVLMAYGAVYLPPYIATLLTTYPELNVPFLLAGSADAVRGLVAAGWTCAILCAAAASMGLLIHRGWTLRFLRLGYAVSAVLFIGLAKAVFLVTSVIQEQDIKVAGHAPDNVALFYWRWDHLWHAGAVVLVLVALYVISWRRRVLSHYTGVLSPNPLWADRMVENLRSHGPDPVFRKSMWSSITTHLMVILIIPWLISMYGCVKDYRVPKGSGTPTYGHSAPVKVVKAKPQKKRKKLLLNTKSAISFRLPDMDDSQAAKDVEELTQVTYKADPMRVLQDNTTGPRGPGGGGKMGAGGGKTGGWPDGMENALVRFIRLEYDGPGWDDGMDGISRADRNFLDEFRTQTGFPVAEKSESHPIAMLAKYRKGFAPPFVYMTGSRQINVSDRDVKIMREYLQEGGMLFADCGSPHWHGSFLSFIQRVLPGQAVSVIADDDPIFQIPYSFPNGAPPIWHHGGTRALGVKISGRWAVFYHPGDINDAWKTGHSGLSPAMAKGSIEMGINIVYYAFSRYLELTRKHRK